MGHGQVYTGKADYSRDWYSSHITKKNKLWQITDFALKGATEESFRGAHWFQPRHISSRDWRLHGSIRQLSARGLVVPHTVLDGQIQAVLQALDGDSGCQTSRDKAGGEGLLIFSMPWLQLHRLELLPREAIAIFSVEIEAPSLDVRVSHVVGRALSQNLNPDTPPLPP